MQAAVNRLPDRQPIRQGDKSRTKPHRATADDAALLGALPIAAAVVGRVKTGLRVLSYNERFRDAVELSTAVREAGKPHKTADVAPALLRLEKAGKLTRDVSASGRPMGGQLSILLESVSTGADDD